jgi:hypothetical protein
MTPPKVLERHALMGSFESVSIAKSPFWMVLDYPWTKTNGGPTQQAILTGKFNGFSEFGAIFVSGAHFAEFSSVNPGMFYAYL